MIIINYKSSLINNNLRFQLLLEILTKTSPIYSITSIYNYSTADINYVFSPGKKFGWIVNITSVYSDNVTIYDIIFKDI